MKVAGLRGPPTLLKADIEGHEYELFRSIAAAPEWLRPEQMAIEMHYHSWMLATPWVHRLKGAAELALTAAMLHASGYMLLDRNDAANGCHTCTEVLCGRVLC